MQVIDDAATRHGAWANGGATWAWLSAEALGMRAYWLLRRPRASEGERHTAITSATNDARQPNDGASPPMRTTSATAPNSAHTQTPPELAAFDRFYSAHEQPLYGYLRRLLPSHEIAVEIAQETFFRAWRHFATFSAYERPEAWLYRVATNLAISHLRRRRPLSLSSILTRIRPGAVESEELDGADLIASPLDVEEQTAQRDTIDGALRALPERQRAALLLAAEQGLTSDEIAAALDVSPDNARKILSRARERFRLLYDAAQRPTT